MPPKYQQTGFKYCGGFNFLFSANPHAIRETEHHRGPVPRLHTDVYEAAVSLCGPVSQLGCGCARLSQRYTGLMLRPRGSFVVKH